MSLQSLAPNQLEGGEQRWTQSDVQEKGSVDSNTHPVDQACTLDDTKTDTSALSDNPFFIPNLAYTREEEARVVRILDTRLFPWVLLTTFVLNMDRTNISNAVSDNLPADLGFTTDTVNLATAIYSVIFSLACLCGAVVCKIVHPARCKCFEPTFFNLLIVFRDSVFDVLLGVCHTVACTNNEQRWIFDW